MEPWCRSNRRFQFKKRGQLFISTHNETLSGVAVGICNSDCSSVGIKFALHRVARLTPTT